MNEKTRFKLHSYDEPYGSGSGQQSVNGFPNVDDANSYWLARLPYDDMKAAYNMKFLEGSPEAKKKSSCVFSLKIDARQNQKKHGVRKDHTREELRYALIKLLRWLVFKMPYEFTPNARRYPFIWIEWCIGKLADDYFVPYSIEQRPFGVQHGNMAVGPKPLIYTYRSGILE
nr:stromal cell-derived factor 2-like protein [Tanacetum cinerariifolium]